VWRLPDSPRQLLSAGQNIARPALALKALGIKLLLLCSFLNASLSWNSPDVCPDNCTRTIRATTYAAIFARFTSSTHDRPLLWAARGRRGVLLTLPMPPTRVLPTREATGRCSVWGMPWEMLQTLPGYDPDVQKNRATARKLMENLAYGPRQTGRLTGELQRGPLLNSQNNVLVNPDYTRAIARIVTASPGVSAA
jgi:hypothetical protein